MLEKIVKLFNLLIAESRMPHYGGQALIEGVLMRGRKYVVAVMRKPDDSLHLEEEKLKGLYTSGLAKIPFFRGLVVLWDSLFLGMKYITLSANLQSEEDDEKIEGPMLFFTLILSLSLSIGLFFVFPTFIIEVLNRILPLSQLLMNVLEGFMRLFLLIAYIWAIGKTKDIARVFAYHGAEHKTINAYENGANITIESVRNFPLAHPRRGTSFLLTLVILSIVVFTIIGPIPSLPLKIISRIGFVPIIAMLAYELIRWTGDHSDNIFVKLMTEPNLMLQQLTTQEPSDDMLEVAITSFNKLIKLEEAN